MPRPPGSGRAKGTPNKKTVILEDLIFNKLNTDLPISLLNDLDEVHNALERAKIKLALMEYLYPKRKALEVSSEMEFNLTSQEELDKQTDEFLTKLSDITGNPK